MAVTVYMLKGLPASGKTTWANELMLSSPNSYKNVNKDDLRAMLDAGRWSKGNEKFILRVRDNIIKDALASGKHVISSDTNLHPKHEQKLKNIAKEYDANFVIVDHFLEVGPEECIRRDLKRANSVGSEVIMGMYNQFLKPPAAVYDPPEHIDPRHTAVIVDIDGTLAHNKSGRSYYDWSRVYEDDVDEEIRSLVNALAEEHSVIVVSGRSDECHKETRRWLVHNHISFDALIMRKADDSRKDAIVKREIFDEHIRDNYIVKLVFDDRQQTIDMWRQELGLKALQVADGNF